jgi:nuclear protein localization protein 4 homolog
LITDDPKLGTVKHVRGIKTHFLTAHECVLAAQFQNKYQNPCKYSSQGCFGSKFVTVCVTGECYFRATPLFERLVTDVFRFVIKR